MARSNRKRPRDRRPARPQDASALAMANGEPVEATDPPEPLAHATPDSEIAAAQLALGRPELSETPSGADLEAYEQAEDEPASRTRAGAVAARPSAHPAAREPAPARLANFIRGSYRELQRVQWPDRRQTMQATGVVIGFVIVAGVFLGVADVVMQKIVNLILYGHG